MADRVSMEQQANDLIDAGKLDDAASIYIQLIRSGCKKPEVFTNLAAIYGVQNRFDDAITLLRTALEVNPNDPNAHYSLGNALQEKGDLKNAILSYQTVLELTPNDPDTYFLLGTAFQKQGSTKDAINAYKLALELKPNDTDAHNSLGICLMREGNIKGATEAFNTALRLTPNSPEVHCNQGMLSNNIGNFDEAIKSYRKAIELKETYPEAQNNLGNVFKQIGDFKSAIDAYKLAIKLKPDFPEAQKNLALLDLLNKDYKNGWKRYEYRLSCSEDDGCIHAEPTCERWDGGELEIDSQLLVVSEQGIGDTLQFMRYILALKEKTSSVKFCTHKKLHPLIQASGIDDYPLTLKQANDVNHGKWVPLLSVPGRLNVCPEQPIITNPYIKTSDELYTKWRNILATEKRPIIAINWQGNPEAEQTGQRGRSLKLEAFKEIAEQTNCALLSLQKGFGSEQLAQCSFTTSFVHCQRKVDKTWDFLETAAIIANCDLVLTSDTAVAHLAGGMGKKTWLVLQKIPDWRWGLEGNSTFWYQSMRLFRQNQQGNWSEVIQRVAKAIREEFSEQSPNQDMQYLATSGIHNARPKASKVRNRVSIYSPISLGE